MRHYRVTFEDAIAAHDLALARSGGRPGLRSENELRSALGRPYSGYYRPIHMKAAALLHSMANNHAFVDGNKRTALLLTNLLIEQSGYWLDVEMPDPIQANREIEDFVVRVVEEHLNVDDIGQWLRPRIQRPWASRG